MLIFVQPRQISEFIWIYCPLKGVPKIPTANSAQTNTSKARSANQTAFRSEVVRIFRNASSAKKPIPSSKMPATRKSDKAQFTSSLNCIAMKGISSRTATLSTMIKGLLFFIVTGFLLFL